MGRKAVQGVVPTEIRVAVVWPRWNVGARCPREPLRRMMGLQAGRTQPTLVNSSKWPPIRSNHGRSAPVRLNFTLSCRLEIGDDLALADFCETRLQAINGIGVSRPQMYVDETIGLRID
jgi:hypothetical protein